MGILSKAKEVLTDMGKIVYVWGCRHRTVCQNLQQHAGHFYDWCGQRHEPGKYIWLGPEALERYSVYPADAGQSTLNPVPEYILETRIQQISGGFGSQLIKKDLVNLGSRCGHADRICDPKAARPSIHTGSCANMGYARTRLSSVFQFLPKR